MSDQADLEKQTDGALEAEQGLPPVVARLVVEIRSDGSRTIARGAMEDLLRGERVALRADASTPVELVKKLSGFILKTPVFASGGALVRLSEAVRTRLLRR